MAIDARAIKHANRYHIGTPLVLRAGSGSRQPRRPPLSVYQQLPHISSPTTRSLNGLQAAVIRRLGSEHSSPVEPRLPQGESHAALLEQLDETTDGRQLAPPARHDEIVMLLLKRQKTERMWLRRALDRNPPIRPAL